MQHTLIINRTSLGHMFRYTNNESENAEMIEGKIQYSFPAFKITHTTSVGLYTVLLFRELF